MKLYSLKFKLHRRLNVRRGDFSRWIAIMPAPHLFLASVPTKCGDFGSIDQLWWGSHCKLPHPQHFTKRTYAELIGSFTISSFSIFIRSHEQEEREIFGFTFLISWLFAFRHSIFLIYSATFALYAYTVAVLLSVNEWICTEWMP